MIHQQPFPGQLLYTTSIQAISPITGKLTSYAGPYVPGISFEDAESYCQTNGLGYCKVEGQLISEIPTKKRTYEPDWEKQVDYDNSDN